MDAKESLFVSKYIQTVKIVIIALKKTNITTKNVTLVEVVMERHSLRKILKNIDEMTAPLLYLSHYDFNSKEWNVLISILYCLHLVSILVLIKPLCMSKTIHTEILG